MANDNSISNGFASTIKRSIVLTPLVCPDEGGVLYLLYCEVGQQLSLLCVTCVRYAHSSCARSALQKTFSLTAIHKHGAKASMGFRSVLVGALVLSSTDSNICRN